MWLLKHIIVILPFGAVLAYAITPNSLIPTRWSYQNHGCDARFKCNITLNNYKYVTK